MVRNVHHRGIGDGAQQFADKTVEFRIGDEMSRLLVAKGPAQNTGKAEQLSVATGQAIRPVVGADQFTLDAKRCRVKRNEVDVLEGSAINRFPKHDAFPADIIEKN